MKTPPVRHDGHLAHDGRDHAINLLDTFKVPKSDVHAADAAWTLQPQAVAQQNGSTT